MNEDYMRSRLALSLLLGLLVLAGCASASVKSSGSENGSSSRMIFGLPF
jgi:hypothetical protein